jgi:hypothetical protein
MPPKRIQVQPARRQQKSGGYFGGALDALTSEENRSVVISVALFGVSAMDLNELRWSCEDASLTSGLQAAVTFLNSEWAELLLPM